MADTYAEDLAAWRARRIANLTAEDGWLNLVGLWWMEDGPVSVGAAAGNDAVLPHGPPYLGTARLGPDNAFTFQPAETGAAPVEFTVPKKGPVRFFAGGFLLEAVALAGRVALRVRDPQSPARQAFSGIDNFPDDPSWRIVADWVPLEAPVEAEVDNVTGAPSAVTITHKAMFERDGRRIELLPTHGTPQVPQFVLRDATSGKQTYPASRFLFGEDIADGKIVLDFNKAINPPCAFTDFAVCPLPPPQNVLPFRIEAGEKRWKS